MACRKYYNIQKMDLGIEIDDLNLNDSIPFEVIDQIKKDVTKYRLVVFRDQGKISGDRHIQISRWFGDIDSSTFTKHPASPSEEIFCVSNDPKCGCTGVGMSGWHIDGTFRPSPYAYSIYHMNVVPKKGGDTMFIPLTELIEKLPGAQRERWERLWMVSDRRGSIVHPLVYPHPKTGRSTLCFHTGMTSAFVFDYSDISAVQFTSQEETASILHEISQAIEDHAKVYSHKWQSEGDFIISDNLAVGHMAGSIPSIDEAGLRVLHRTTVIGSSSPSKMRPVEHADCAY